MHIIFWTMILVPAFSLGAAGFYGDDVKIKSKQKNVYIVEQAGFRMQIDAEKLSSGLQEKWKKNVGNTIESSIPYDAVIREEKIANYKAPQAKNR